MSDGLPGTGTDPSAGTDPSVGSQDDARIPEAEPQGIAGPPPDPTNAETPEEPVVKGLDRGRSRRSGLAWAVGILSVLLVVAIAFAVVAGINWADLYAAEQSREDVREEATALVLSLTTFEGENIEEWVADAQSRATGDYAEQLSTLFDQSLRDALREQEVVSRGEVDQLFVQDVDGDEASVFALVTQTIVNATTSDPVQDELRMDITMERVDGEWLASDVAVLGPAGLVGGAPEAPQAPAIEAPSTEGGQ